MYLLFCTFQDVYDWLGASRDLPLYFVPVHQGQNGSIVHLPHENLQPHGEVMKPVEMVMIYMFVLNFIHIIHVVNKHMPIDTSSQLSHLQQNRTTLNKYSTVNKLQTSCLIS